MHIKDLLCFVFSKKKAVNGSNVENRHLVKNAYFRSPIFVVWSIPLDFLLPLLHFLLLHLILLNLLEVLGF